MTDAIALQALSSDVEAAVLAVPGVIRAQDRPGMSRLARRLAGGIAAGAGAPLGGLPHGGGAAISVLVGEQATTVELDVVVGAGESAPAVARDVAAAVLGRLDLEALPPARVDVRVVAFG